MIRVKQVLTRFATMFLALICVIGMGTQVLAVEGDLQAEDQFYVTVDGFDVSNNPTLTLNVYQIISVDFDNATSAPKNPMFYWDVTNDTESTTSVAEWVRNHYSDCISDDNSVTDKFKSMGSDAQSKFLEELSAAINTTVTENKVTIDSSKIKTVSVTAPQGTSDLTNVSCTIEDLTMGEYLLIASGGVKLYKPTTIQLLPKYVKEQGATSGKWVVNVPQNTSMKGAAPQIEKTVASGNETVETGETVTYTLSVDVPSYPADATAMKFEIGDTMDAGITYQSDVKVYSDSNCTQEILAEKNKNYIVTNMPNSANGFNISFTNAFFAHETYGKLTKIYVKYTGTVNTTAFSSATDALGNNAYVKYNNNPYDSNSSAKDTDTKDVYAYRVEINKIDNNGKPLTGAKFKLSKKGTTGTNTELKFSKVTNPSDNGYFYVYNPSGDITELEVSALAGDPATGGTFLIKGLDQGEYVLTETKAPDGYVLPTGSITITLDGIDTDLSKLDKDTTTVASSGTHKLHAGQGSSDGSTITNETISLDVENTSSEEANFILPSTGGMGTLIFTVGGLFVMAGAVVLAVVMYKKKNA